jgi:hypothetical protein
MCGGRAPFRAPTQPLRSRDAVPAIQAVANARSRVSLPPHATPSIRKEAFIRLPSHAMVAGGGAFGPGPIQHELLVEQ